LILTSYGKGAVILTTGRIHCKKDICHNLRQFEQKENPTRFMKTPERTTAEVFPRYLGGEVLADSAMLKWPGFFARRYRFPRVMDGFLVPATAEPLITCQLLGKNTTFGLSMGD
jgi:hypothetical protein